MRDYFLAMCKGYKSRDSAYQMVEFIEKEILPMLTTASREEVLEFIQQRLREVTSKRELVTADNLAEQSLLMSTSLYLQDYLRHFLGISTVDKQKVVPTMIYVKVTYNGKPFEGYVAKTTGTTMIVVGPVGILHMENGVPTELFEHAEYLQAGLTGPEHRKGVLACVRRSEASERDKCIH